METASRRRLLLAALGVAVTVLITLVVLAARSSSLQAGDGPTNAGPVIAIVHVIEIVGIALELLAILILIVVFRLSRRRDEDDDDAPTKSRCACTGSSGSSPVCCRRSFWPR